MPKKDTLVIIGNGFDLAHGYKTSYLDFRKSEPYKTSAFYNYYKKYYGNDEKGFWVDFENAISVILDNYMCENLFDNDINLCLWLMDLYAYVFDLKSHISDFLFREMENNIESKNIILPNIEKFLGKDSYIINFNYTHTAERYNCHPFYIHGDVNDSNNIVLGFDYRDTSKCEINVSQKLSKNYQRQFLFIIRELIIRHAVFSDYYLIVQKALLSCYTGKGYDKKIISGKPYSRYINKYISDFQNSKGLNIFSGLVFEDIKHLVIMGHGLKADEYLLTNLLKKCVNIEEIILFTYKNESMDRINKKIEFLRTTTTNCKIITLDYK